MSSAPPRVKVCGITRVVDAVAAVEMGADYLGLNFYDRSPRAVDVATARQIAGAVAEGSRLVGVFVNHPSAQVEEIAQRVGLDLLQFHGDETPAYLRQFGERAIRALRIDGPIGAETVAAYPDAWGFLIDVHHPTLYGGTSRSWSYDWIDTLPRDRPVLIAGGIRPGAAASAARASRAWGIDVCSGVESQPGIKDHGLLRRLITEVKGEPDSP